MSGHKMRISFQKASSIWVPHYSYLAQSLGERLYLYLVISKAATSSALVREEQGVQKPIYYNRQILEGAKTRYSKLENVVLALVTTT